MGILTPDELSGSEFSGDDIDQLISDAFNFFSDYIVMSESEQDKSETRQMANEILDRMKKTLNETHC